MSARQLHRQLAWVAGVVALLWASTGFLHPIMTWTAPRAAVQAPPDAHVSMEGVMAPGAAFSALGLTQTSLVRLIEEGGQRYWLAVATNGQHVSVDAVTGAPAPEIDAAHAVTLARHYAVLPNAPVAFARKVEAFSTNYPPVNKLLPVWEVRFARPDGLTLYVEPGADRLAMTTNDPRRVMLAVFQNVHTLKFLEGVELLRLALIAVLVGALLVTTLFGGWMLIGANGRGLRVWHRTIAWIALPLTLAFTGSGLFHLFATSSLVERPAPQAAPFDAAGIDSLPRVSGVDRADISVSADAAGAPLWRVAPEGAPALYFDAQGRTVALDDAQRARMLAGADATAPVMPVMRFGATYGFVNKRLPVYQVGVDAHAVFVDLREGVIAARAERGLVATEAWSFDTIHKWEPVAEAIGRRNRDYLTMLAVAVIAITALLGLFIAARRRTKGQI